MLLCAWCSCALVPVLALVLIAASDPYPPPSIAASALYAQQHTAVPCASVILHLIISPYRNLVPTCHTERAAYILVRVPGALGEPVLWGLLLSCLGSPWGVAASGAPGSPGVKLPQGELGSPRYTYPRHTRGVRFVRSPGDPLGIPTGAPEVPPGAPRFFAVVTARLVIIKH